MQLLDQLDGEPRWQVRRKRVACSTDAAALLTWLPHETEGWVRAAMAKVFGELGGPESQKALEQLVHDESGLVQREAVKALDRLQTLTARFTLRETYAQAEDHNVRRAVIETQVPVGQSPELLGESRLLVPEGVARGKLHFALAHLTDPHSRALAIYNTMLEVGKAIVPSLRDLWKTETEPVVRQMLVDLLANLGEREERQLLLRSLVHEPTIQVRRDIIRIFTKWGGRETRQVFLAALPTEPDENLQVTLIQALTRWKDWDVVHALYSHQTMTVGAPLSYQASQAAIHELIDSLPLVELGICLPREPEAGIRLAIVKIVRHRGAGARNILISALRTEPDPDVRAELIEAVAVWGDEEEIRTLLYECLYYGGKNGGVFTILRILAGHYPPDELNALARPYFDSITTFPESRPTR
jgi:HEAT repeats